jgi:hypothetical protein
MVRALLPAGAALAGTLGHLSLLIIVIARAIALTILCLPHSLADENRVGSLARPDTSARFSDARNQATILPQTNESLPQP